MAICLAYIYSRMDLQVFAKFGANRPSRLTAFPDFWICDTLTPPPEMPPRVLKGDLYLAYVHSQMNPQTWAKVGANRTASKYFRIVDPIKPHKCPLVFRGAICLSYIHSHMNLNMCAKFGANRSICLAAFPDLYLWPPKTPPKCPLWYWGANCI